MGETVCAIRLYMNVESSLEGNLVTALQEIIDETAEINVRIRTNIRGCHTSGTGKGLLEKNKVKLLIEFLHM